MAGAGIFLFVGESQLFLGTHDLLPTGHWNYSSGGNVSMRVCLFASIISTVNPLPPNDIYMSYRTANLQALHFKYLFNKYPY
jgi:hypothetical protein